MTRSPRRLFLAGALLLATCASANAVSLSSFQFIATDGIPLGCIVAYNKPLIGCSDDDFGSGNSCSSLCVRSIEKITETLASACGGANPANGSLLDLAMSGDLLDALCPTKGGGDDDDDDDDNNETTTTSPRVTTTTVRLSTLPGTATTTTAPASNTGTTFFTSRTLSSTSSTPLAADPLTTTQSDTTTFLIPTTTTNGNGGGLVGTTATSEVPGSTETASDGNGDEDFPGGAGGGSPFDAITSDAPLSASGFSLGWRASVALAAAVAAGMFAL